MAALPVSLRGLFLTYSVGSGGGPKSGEPWWLVEGSGRALGGFASLASRFCFLLGRIGAAWSSLPVQKLVFCYLLLHALCNSFQCRICSKLAFHEQIRIGIVESGKQQLLPTESALLD